MKQSELNRAIAQATGESVSMIRSLGFMLDTPNDGCQFQDDDFDFGPNIIDWDEVELERNTSNTWSPDDALAIA